MKRFPSVPAKTKLTTTNNLLKQVLLFLVAKLQCFFYTHIIICATFFLFRFISQKKRKKAHFSELFAISNQKRLPQIIRESRFRTLLQQVEAEALDATGSPLFGARQILKGGDGLLGAEVNDQ